MGLCVSPCRMGGLGGHRYSAQLMLLSKTPFPIAALVQCQYILPSSITVKGTDFRAVVRPGVLALLPKCSVILDILAFSCLGFL